MLVSELEGRKSGKTGANEWLADIFQQIRFENMPADKPNIQYQQECAGRHHGRSNSEDPDHFAECDRSEEHTSELQSH